MQIKKKFNVETWSVQNLSIVARPSKKLGGGDKFTPHPKLIVKTSLPR